MLVSVWVSRLQLSWSGSKHSQAQQCEAGPAVALSLDEFGAIDVSLKHTIGLGKRESRLHCRQVSFDAVGKDSKTGQVT